MKTYINPAEKRWPELAKRPVADNASLTKTVSAILDAVRKKGDKALFEFSSQFDKVVIDKLEVSADEIEDAGKQLSPDLKKAILKAKQNITLFHKTQQETVTKIETMPGVNCWRKPVAIEKVGLYIPGGSAPLFSTVLMLAIPAGIAGCKEIILCTPSDKEGKIHPAILYSAKLCGVTKIFKTGGAQAIAAMAYGTESVPKVFKIFGPGNQYVTAAKQLVQQQGVAIDMPAGPSEVLVIADETAVPEFVAADLLSQAEHGPDSQVILVTTTKTFAEKVTTEISLQIKQLPRKGIATAALKNSKIIIVDSLEKAIRFSNSYAPEHLILACTNAEKLSAMVTSAGSAFIGNYSPESAGDYASGTNHTLPTNGYAAMYSGVSLDSFVKKITFQKLSKKGLKNIGETIMAMAATEGLEAHRNAVAIRLKNKKSYGI